MGEERFAPDGQRDRIAVAFRDGMVGAEVVVDGTPWAIVRSIGIGRSTVAVPNGDLDELAVGAIDSTGMSPFLEAVQDRILSNDVAGLVPGAREREAWLIALAWLTRDQECRFDDVLDWRSAASESGSPARGLSTTRTLEALRALVGAISPEEHALRQEESQLERARNDAEREAGHREWEAAQNRTRLTEALHLRQEELPPGSLEVEVFRKAAREQLARIAQIEPAADVADLNALRTACDDARHRAEDRSKALAETEARIPESERIVSRIRGELPGLSYSVHESEHSVCPICEVPIDRALAEGCKVSHMLPDLDEVRKRREQCQRDLDEETRRLADRRESKARLGPELVAARQRVHQLRQRLHDAERARDTQKDAWYAARRLTDDADGFAEVHRVRDGAASEVQRLTAAIESKRERAAAYREEGTRVFQRVSQTFDAIIRDLAGPEASGRIALDGNGLHLTVELGGERSTAAIDSLKVLAFDLAVLCVSMEGTTHLPAFLLHDSPREADLGLSVYHRLFRFASSLEEIGERPLFQYIVTTTTRPPDELNTEPWLCLILEGAPAEKRLLRRDL